MYCWPLLSHGNCCTNTVFTWNLQSKHKSIRLHQLHSRLLLHRWLNSTGLSIWVNTAQVEQETSLSSALWEHTEHLYALRLLLTVHNVLAEVTAMLQEQLPLLVTVSQDISAHQGQNQPHLQEQLELQESVQRVHTVHLPQSIHNLACLVTIATQQISLPTQNVLYVIMENTVAALV